MLCTWSRSNGLENLSKIVTSVEGVERGTCIIMDDFNFTMNIFVYLGSLSIEVSVWTE